MNPSERIKLIPKIAEKLGQEEWNIIDLTLRQYSLPTTDYLGVNKFDYVIDMIQNANDEYLEALTKHLGLSQSFSDISNISTSEINKLADEIEQQKSLMINVSTGRERIQEVNQAYIERRHSILSKLQKLGINDPNNFGDLWNWYNKWKDGSLPSYASRRTFITNLYQQVLDDIALVVKIKANEIVIEPTGWERVDRNLNKIIKSFSTAKNEEDFQGLGLLCREAIISLAQAVYDPALHESVDGVIPSETDAKRMLENYIASELSNGSNEELRRYSKDCFQLAVTLQHKRNANYREAALCVEAIRSLVNIIGIISSHH
jgi:hypothetical protein